MSRKPDAAALQTGSALGMLNRRYAWFIVAFAVFTLAMAQAERSGLSRGWIGGAFLFATVTVYASIGFYCRTMNPNEYFLAGRRVPAFYNGVATAADWVSAASFIGTAGVLYLQGFSGLAFILGWTGGYCLLALLLVPYLRRFGQYTLPDFLGARYGGRGPRVVGALATVLVSFIYLVAQIYGVGLITSHLTGMSFEVGIMVGLGGVLVCSFLGGMRAVTWTQVTQYIVLIVAFLVPLMWLSVKQTGLLLPLGAYEQQIQGIAHREKALMADPAELDVAQRLRTSSAQAQRKLLDVADAVQTDIRLQSELVAALRVEQSPLAQIQRAERELQALPRTETRAKQVYEHARDTALKYSQPLAGMAPQTLPFAQTSPGAPGAWSGGSNHARLNFIALMLCLMVGTAVMPHLVVRFQTTPTVNEARESVAWSLLFVVILYLAAPALAVLVKHEVLHHVVGLPFDELPRWLARWSKLDPGLVSVQDVNGDGILQLAELRLSGDAIVLAAPEIGGLPYFATCLVAAGGLAAALSTADGLLLTIANAVSHDIYYRTLNPDAPALRRVIVSKMLIMMVAVAAALVASLHITDILQFVSAAFSLAGAAFFPALVLGIFWRRANHAGAMAGMLIGLGVCGYYLAMNQALLRRWLGVTQGLESTQWFGIDAIAAGVFAVPLGAAALVLVSLATAPPAASQRGVLDEVRRPALNER